MGLVLAHVPHSTPKGKQPLLANPCRRDACAPREAARR
jgi:hypothetical protein